MLDKLNKYFFQKTLLIALFVGTIFLLTLNPIKDYDTGFHIQAGDYILANHEIPKTDIFSYTASGSKWIAHYWLSDVAFSIVNLKFGYLGLIILVSLVSAISYYIVIKTIELNTKKIFVPLILIIPYTFLTYELWVVRPQVFSYLLLALLIYLLERWRKTEKKYLLYFLPPLMILWANMHASVVLGILVIGLYGLVHLWVNNFSIIRTRGVLLPMFVACLGTLLNPNGYYTLIYSSIIGKAVKAMGVMEWRSIVYFLVQHQAKFFLGLMIFTGLFVAWRIFRNKNDYKQNSNHLIYLGLMGAAITLPILSIRHVGFFPFLSFFIFCWYLEKWMEEKEFDVEKISLVKKIIIVIGLLMLLSGLFRLPQKKIFLDNLLPDGAINFIKKENISGPMFNSQSFGGYLIWKLWPAQKIFYDGRSEIYMGEVDDEYKKIILGKEDWEKIIREKYKINYFILGYKNFNGSLNGLIGEAFTKLTDIGFKMVYWDDSAIILVDSENTKNKNLIGRFGYNVINPFLDPQIISSDKMLKAFREASRMLAISPKADYPQQYVNLLISIASQKSSLKIKE